jgi:hypothetical protein
LKGKITNNRLRLYGRVLRMNEERIPENVLNMEIKWKQPRGRQRLRWEQQIRKNVTQKEGRTWE